VAFLRVRNLEPAARRLAQEATAVLRRRLAVQYRELIRAEGGELYVLDRSDFAIVGLGLSPNRAEELGRQLARITESFAPNGNVTLKLSIGHAGPEVTDEIATLRELAQRALSVAAEQPTSAVVGADSLSLGLASTTELEAALRTLDVAERGDRHLQGHGQRIAQLVSELAWSLGFDAAERASLRVAAHFHDLGKVSLAADVAASSPDALSGVALDDYRGPPRALGRQRLGAVILPGARRVRGERRGTAYQASSDMAPSAKPSTPM
jgi:HD-GYP domain-containing protein (c-di-GMP phosphodiesterase class II)